MAKSPKHRVGVLFGGRSGEHAVSLASARNVMAALAEAGHEVVPIGISRHGAWLTTDDPLDQLTAAAALLQVSEETEVSEGTEVSAVISAEPNIQQLPTQVRDGWGLIQTDSHASLPQIDVMFPVLHGPYGEDGTIQGLLEMANIPYVGCGVLASAISMDKAIAKKLFSVESLPQTAYQVLSREGWQADQQTLLAELEAQLHYPVFVKPANLGSSVGISKAHDRPSLVTAITLAAQYDRKIIVEEGVHPAREIEVSVLGISDTIEHMPIASVVGEIVPDRDFYDYQAKYHDDKSQLLIPAPLDATQSDTIRTMALQAFHAVDGSGLARVDFLMNRTSGQIYLNEVNTMPGFTRISMYPKLWEASGLPYPKLVDKLVQLAIVRHTDRQRNLVT